MWSYFRGFAVLVVFACTKHTLVYKYINEYIININNIYFDMNHAETKRPYLKGISHWIAFFLYIGFIKVVGETIPIPAPIKLPILCYLLFVLSNFLVSGMLHFFAWEGDALSIMRKMDHIIIYLKIISTYVAIISTVLTDIKPIVPLTLGISSIFGVISRIFFTDIHKIYITIPYFVTGLSILLDTNIFYNLYTRTYLGMFFCIFGGLFYIFGGLFYIKGSPNLYPGVFEFHELYHMFVIFGTLCFTVYIFAFAIPYYSLSVPLVSS